MCDYDSGLEYGIFYGKYIIDAVRKAFSFDELKENAKYKRDRISAYDIELYAKKIADRVIQDRGRMEPFDRDFFNLFPNNRPSFFVILWKQWKDDLFDIIVNEIEAEYISWLCDNHFIPNNCVSFDEIKELDDLDDKDLWNTMLGKLNLEGMYL